MCYSLKKKLEETSLHAFIQVDTEMITEGIDLFILIGHYTIYICIQYHILPHEKIGMCLLVENVKRYIY